MSTDAGETVKDVSGNLPRGNVYDVKVAGDYVYAAHDLGVFVAKKGTSTWSKMGPNLPVGRVYGLSISADRKELVASHYGAGVWTIALPGGAAPLPTKTVKPGAKPGTKPGNLAATGGAPLLAGLGALALGAALVTRRRRAQAAYDPHPGQEEAAAARRSARMRRRSAVALSATLLLTAGTVASAALELGPARRLPAHPPRPGPADPLRAGLGDREHGRDARHAVRQEQPPGDRPAGPGTGARLRHRARGQGLHLQPGRPSATRATAAASRCTATSTRPATSAASTTAPSSSRPTSRTRPAAWWSST